MKYATITKGRFISRPNRFIAVVEVDGAVEVVHVKNTGRCRELLVPGARVVLDVSANPQRKTKYDLIAVYKNKRLVNMDSQAPNKVFGEWLESGGLFEDITYIKPECKFGNSRFDFYIETKDKKIFAEVKGVTLENNGVVSFPDAPTERGVKHLKELINAVDLGYEAYAVFVIQMNKCEYFCPNEKTHPEFASVLREAVFKGVKVIALTCKVSSDSLYIDKFARVII